MVSVPKLPYELVRLIFELATSENHHTAFTLVLVSRVSRNWLEHQLYPKVHLSCQAEEEAFERSRIARDDDAFIANAFRQLYATPNTTLLAVCTNITHLSLRPYADEDPAPISLRHLENIKYLALGFDTVPYYFNVYGPEFVHTCPALSHIMIDWTTFDYYDVVAASLSLLLDRLPLQHLHSAIALHDAMSFLTQYDLRSLQAQYPRLFLVDCRAGSPLQGMMKCNASLISRFEFWDNMEEFLARTRA